MSFKIHFRCGNPTLRTGVNAVPSGPKSWGGTPHRKGGMLVGNFELNPLRATDLRVAQAFF